MPKLEPTDVPPTARGDAAIRAGIAADHDTLELKDSDFDRVDAVAKVAPHIVERAGRHRGTQRMPTKERITIRLDADIAAHFRATGKGWQTRLNAILRRAIAAESNGSLE